MCNNSRITFTNGPGHLFVDWCKFRKLSSQKSSGMLGIAANGWMHSLMEYTLSSNKLIIIIMIIIKQTSQISLTKLYTDVQRFNSEHIWLQDKQLQSSYFTETIGEQRAYSQNTASLSFHAITENSIPDYHIKRRVKCLTQQYRQQIVVWTAFSSQLTGADCRPSARSASKMTYIVSGGALNFTYSSNSACVYSASPATSNWPVRMTNTTMTT